MIWHVQKMLLSVLWYRCLDLAIYTDLLTLRQIPETFSETETTSRLPNNAVSQKSFPLNFSIYYRKLQSTKINAIIDTKCLNPFYPNVPFLYPLKTSENLWFQGLQKCKIRLKWVKMVEQQTCWNSTGKFHSKIFQFFFLRFKTNKLLHDNASEVTTVTLSPVKKEAQLLYSNWPAVGDLF